MASGWANDDAVQEQIDSTINDAIARARNELSSGESNKFCEECGSRFLRRADGRWRG
jgi:RNA polymerase-binding transcription factor DksA